jgi:hypothetical protein
MAHAYKQEKITGVDAFRHKQWQQTHAGVFAEKDVDRTGRVGTPHGSYRKSISAFRTLGNAIPSRLVRFATRFLVHKP